MIASFEHKHTRYFLIPGGAGYLLFDAGWPGELLGFMQALKATGIGFEEIRWAMVSHFHLDHAGLLGELQARGIECWAFGNQLTFIDPMEALILRKTKEYRPIAKAGLKSLSCPESRGFLHSLGIDGQVLATPGHSDDSVSFLGGGGEALIGDLYPLAQVMPEDRLTLSSWDLLRSEGARSVFPSHAQAFALG